MNDFPIVLKAMSILDNTLVIRAVDNPLMMKLVIDSIVYKFSTSINTNLKSNEIEKGDILRLLQYCEAHENLVEQLLDKIKSHKHLRQDIDIALYSKIGHD